MSIKCSRQITAEASRGRPNGLLDRLRAVALIAVVVGTVGAVGLTLQAGRSTPRLLLVLVVLWVLSAFVALT